MGVIRIKPLIIILILIFLFMILSSDVFAQKKILVLHSYHQGLEWTDQISEGIRSVFPYNDKVKIFYEYLDAKRNYSEKYYDKLISLYREKAKIINFDVIIVSDNAAFNFILEYGEELYPKTPIVFCGVNNFNSNFLVNKEDICGIVENADHRKIIDLILKLHPNLNELIIINDQTLTGKNIQEELKVVLKDYKNKIEYEIWDTFTLNDLQNRLISLDQNDVIYLLVFNRDRAGNFISYNQGIDIIKSVSKNPIYGAWDFYLGKGILGGKLISAQAQGKEAALMAKKIINGQQDFREKIVFDKGSNFYFDYLELKKYNITENDLPAGSRIVNQPDSFFKKNNRYLLWGLAFLIFIILILIIIYYLKNKEKEKLDKLNLELEQKVKQRTRELEKMTITDELTDLFNRRHILDLLEIEIKKASRYNRNLSVIMIDIDFFKKVNDNHGHQFGDKVLKILSDILQQNTRNIDFVGRYGGEEFLIILPETDLDQAYLVAEKLRKTVKETQISGLESGITISCGAAQFEDDLGHQLIKRADDLLYKAKAKGRDRVEI
ncbi:diguanylate cyclase (GGDEF domain) [Halanaerobium saccharolyticum subsp. saccharolyticum DSM 6643]|uniref:Diguanylate cyclase (GGDEF domain) n=2 Tax=Halanaerobium saccharolyticum TaxID=43595 RepID=M5DZQ4_9FIRM|nr:diguanylate cyclase (GGDEF domain) [Halanaerobium saccharolyticum subsp. saccharolyticum DSM 6643]